MEQARELFLKNTKYVASEIQSILPIHSGYSNSNFLLTLNNGKKFQIRISKGINTERENELRALQLLNDNNFIYFNKNGDAIKKWIEGSTVNQWNDELIIDLVKKIKKLHSINPTGLMKHDYKKRLFTDLPKKYLDYYLQLVEKYKDEKYVLSHNDINPNNIIVSNNEAYLIDFEYARANSPYWDIANLIKESNFNTSQIGLILNIYKELNPDKLKDYIYINIYYSYSWALSHPNKELIEEYRQKIKKKIINYF